MNNQQNPKDLKDYTEEEIKKLSKEELEEVIGGLGAIDLVRINPLLITQLIIFQDPAFHTKEKIG